MATIPIKWTYTQYSAYIVTVNYFYRDGGVNYFLSHQCGFSGNPLWRIAKNREGCL